MQRLKTSLRFFKRPPIKMVWISDFEFLQFRNTLQILQAKLNSQWKFMLMHKKLIFLRILKSP